MEGGSDLPREYSQELNSRDPSTAQSCYTPLLTVTYFSTFSHFSTLDMQQINKQFFC